MNKSFKILENIRAVINKKLKKSDIEYLIKDENIALIEVSILYKLKESDLKLLNELFEKRKDITFLQLLENEWLTYLPDLEKVEIAPYTFDKDTVNYLKNLKKITSLSFGSSGSKKSDIAFLLDYKESLTQLRISGDIKLNQEYILKELIHLNRISLISGKYENLDFLKYLPNLEILLLHGSKILNYDSLFELNNIKNLSILKNKVWDDFSFLEKMKNLETLTLSACSKLEYFPQLSDLHHLSKVTVYDCKSIINLNELDKLAQHTTVLINMPDGKLKKL